MHRFCGNLTAELTGEVIEVADSSLDGAALALCALGAAVLGMWLWRFGGPAALERAPVRRHCVPVWLPFAIFLGWLVTVFLSDSLNVIFFGEAEAATAGRYVIVLAANVVLSAGMLAAGYVLFARRLKGFGLDPKTLPRDAGWGVVYLAAVYPLVVAGVMLVTLAGQLWTGEEFVIPAHETLGELLDFESLWARVLVIVLVTTMVPVMEELLFRGLMQSAIQGVLPGRWPAILMTSALFAIVHAPTHAPAIFALSCGLGYAYERSGSLFRPIAMHVLFNAMSVAAALLT